MTNVYLRFVHKPFSNHPPTALTIVEGEKVGADGGKKLPNVLPNGHPNHPQLCYTVISVCSIRMTRRILPTAYLPTGDHRRDAIQGLSGIHAPMWRLWRPCQRLLSFSSPDASGEEARSAGGGAAFHRHAAAAAAANPSTSGIPSLPLALACSALCAVSEANARERSLQVGMSVGVRFWVSVCGGLVNAICLLPPLTLWRAAPCAAAGIVNEVCE